MKELDPKTIDLLEFLDSSTSPYHATRNVQKRLLSAGFTHLRKKQGGTAPEAIFSYGMEVSLLGIKMRASSLIKD